MGPRSSLKFLPLGVFDTSVKIESRNKQTSRFNLNFLIVRIRRHVVVWKRWASFLARWSSVLSNYEASEILPKLLHFGAMSVVAGILMFLTLWKE